jgi:hypothetical protein
MAASSTNHEIPRQVTLPMSVAFEVVMQGIRIRFGRSVVTVTGVLFGIAFLMSIFTGIVLKKGLSSEEQLRIEVNRMLSFLTAETGQPKGHVLGLIIDGPLKPAEEKLLLALDAQGLDKLQVVAPASVTLPILSTTQVQRVSIDSVGAGASGVLWTGAKEPEGGWSVVFKNARQNLLALTRDVPRPQVTSDIHLVLLASALTDEQKAKEEVAAKRENFRNGWIITISLLVTVIGISNAMLMSVTERFREIGTMKCLGALSAFVRRMFLIESALMGLVGGILGCVVGFVFSVLVYMISYGFDTALHATLAGLGTLLLFALASLVCSLILSTLAALYPASVASEMVPATALRSSI